jgi:hypothetical protein
MLYLESPQNAACTDALVRITTVRDCSLRTAFRDIDTPRDVTASTHDPSAVVRSVTVPPAINFHAYSDEAGQRSASGASSHHFVMAAVVVTDAHVPEAATYLAKLRADLGRNPGDTLHWQNLKGHSLRLHAAQTLGAANWATIFSVVVSKRHLSLSVILNDDQAYLYTYRLLLERLSWYSRDHDGRLSYTLAHVVRFNLHKLREYEARLRDRPDCQIVWSALDQHGGRLDQPNRVEYLQLADIAASAIFAAFEPDKFGNTEKRYLEALVPRLYRRGSGALTSYGLKMHPWSESTRSAYPWVADL